MEKALRILVVDDNKELVTTTMELVRLMGHQCHGCHTGKQAVECVDEFDPDVLIMDLSMPEMTGWEAAKKIRERHDGTRPMLIAVTGQYTRGPDRMVAAMNGFDYYLVKPTDPKVLQVLIDRFRRAA
jgi:two-component system CheB/CheR fusion protein